MSEIGEYKIETDGVRFRVKRFSHTKKFNLLKLKYVHKEQWVYLTVYDYPEKFNCMKSAERAIENDKKEQIQLKSEWRLVTNDDKNKI